jgi:hypothetical protein
MEGVDFSETSETIYYFTHFCLGEGGNSFLRNIVTESEY